MIRQKSNIFYKKTMAGLLAAAVVVSGIVIASSASKAAQETTSVGIIYDDNFKIAEYWTKEKKEAPIKEDYVFGGWYTENSGIYTALTEVEAESAAEAESATGIYAKFVPAYVLSVKAQNQEGTKAGDGNNTSMRVISSVDCTDYQKVGFDIWLANKKQLFKEGSTNEPLETTRIYTGLKVGTEEVREPETIFGEASRFLSVWRLDDIYDINDGKIIYVRPYWITSDGTKVEGLAKYVHVEDGYLNYISVPVNLLTGEAVAAGSLQMAYDSSKLEFVDFATGRLLTEMEENHGTAGIIRIIGSAAAVNENVSADGIFANVRFRVKDNGSDMNNLIFSMTQESFCDWTEEMITTVKAWNVQY